jgi:hypothetical protein
MERVGENCEKCGEFVEGFEYTMCCSGHECGCMGKPIEPCLCDDCAKEIYGPAKQDDRVGEPVDLEKP